MKGDSNMEKIQFENGQLITGAYVTIDGIDYPVQMPIYTGSTPLSAETLNQLQDNIEEAIEEKYSTSEEVVAIWIDNKPIYRKVIDFGALPNNTSKSVTHGINNLSQVISLTGFAGSSINNGGIPIPHAVDNYPVFMWIDDTDVFVQTTSDRTGYTKTYIIIEYTKN